MERMEAHQEGLVFSYLYLTEANCALAIFAFVLGAGKHAQFITVQSSLLLYFFLNMLDYRKSTISFFRLIHLIVVVVWLVDELELPIIPIQGVTEQPVNALSESSHQVLSQIPSKTHIKGVETIINKGVLTIIRERVLNIINKGVVGIIWERVLVICVSVSISQASSLLLLLLLTLLLLLLLLLLTLLLMLLPLLLLLLLLLVIREMVVLKLPVGPQRLSCSICVISLLVLLIGLIQLIGARVVVTVSIGKQDIES